MLQGEQGPGAGNKLGISKSGEDQASFKSSQKTQGSRGKGSKQLKPCYRCTGSHHSQKCPFIKERCYHCGIMGHTQQACRKKQATQQTNDPGVNVMGRADSEESDREYGDLYHVSDSKNRRPISLKVYLEGGPLVMELHTGSAVSVMSQGVYQEHLRHVPLKDTSMKLHTYTGEPVEPMGFCNVTVQYKGQSKELPIYVMENDGPTLFGREWLESIRLDWPLLQLGTSNVVPALEEVLSKHALSVSLKVWAG